MEFNLKFLVTCFIFSFISAAFFMTRSSFLYGDFVMIAIFPRCLVTLLHVLFSLGTGIICSGVVAKLESLSTIQEHPGSEEGCLGGVRISLSCSSVYDGGVLLPVKISRCGCLDAVLAPV